MFYSLFRLWFSTEAYSWEGGECLMQWFGRKQGQCSLKLGCSSMTAWPGSIWLAQLSAVSSEKHMDILFSSYVTSRAHQHHKGVTSTRHHQGMAHVKWNLLPFSAFINMLVYFITLQGYHPYLYLPPRNSISRTFWRPLLYNNIWICLLLTVSFSGKHCWVWATSLLLYFSGSIYF